MPGERFLLYPQGYYISIKTTGETTQKANSFQKLLLSDQKVDGLLDLARYFIFFDVEKLTVFSVLPNLKIESLKRLVSCSSCLKKDRYSCKFMQN